MLPGTTATLGTGLAETSLSIIHLIPATPNHPDALERSAAPAALLPPILPANLPTELAIPTTFQGPKSPTKRLKRKRSLTEKAEGIVARDGGWGDIGWMHARKKMKYTV
jgi:hypothetical protein